MTTQTKSNCGHLACSLTPPELQQRKATVIAELQRTVLEVRETEHGYNYRFGGTDDVLMSLAEFIRTERQCCGFFTFALTVGNEQNDIWLALSGPEGAKEFIRTELGMTGDTQATA